MTFVNNITSSVCYFVRLIYSCLLMLKVYYRPCSEIWDDLGGEVRVHMNVVPRSTMNTNGGTENYL